MSCSLRFWVDFEQEVCCDMCQEVVHVHFDSCCPVCGTVRSGTNLYHSVSDCIKEDDGVFACGECNSSFKILNYEWASDEPADALIEVLEWDDK